MGLESSKSKTLVTDSLEDTDEEKYRLAYKITEFISTKIANRPFKLKLIAIYYSLYERMFGPWGRIVGSYADGLSVSSSDVDFILDHVQVYSNHSEIPYDGKSCFVVYTDDVDIPPGCCWLRTYRKDSRTGVALPTSQATFPYYIQCGLTKRREDIEWKMKKMKGLNLLSSKSYSEVKERAGLTTFTFLNYILPTWSPHGPAFRQTYFKIFDVDILEGFACRTVPQALKKWVMQKRKKWPKPETIEKVLEQGCNIIAIPSKITSAEFEEVEFRFGYGDMEKVLINSLNDCQKHCYLLLKIILKEYIEPQFPDEDLISSYMIKTLIFWMAEETNSNIWEAKNLLHCLQMCLEQLYKWLNSGNCPQYFIPEYNLFRTKDLQKLENLKIWFQSLIDLKWKILLKCDSTKCLFS